MAGDKEIVAAARALVEDWRLRGTVKPDGISSGVYVTRAGSAAERKLFMIVSEADAAKERK